MALEWLAGILGDAYTEDIDKKISGEIGKGFVAKSDFNVVNEAKKSLEGQVNTMTAQLDELKKADPTKLQEEITRLQGENTAAKDKYEKDLEKIKLNSAVEVALMGAKARDVKAVMPFIDMDIVKIDGDKLLGFDDQIKNLKETKGYLFEESRRTTRTGMSHQGGRDNFDDDKKEAANAAFRSLFGIE